MLLVADGVGGGAAGSLASRLAVEAVARYLATSLRRFHAAGTPVPDERVTIVNMREATGEQAVQQLGLTCPVDKA